MIPKLRAWDTERKRMHDVLIIRFEDEQYTRVIFKEEHQNSSADGYENDWQYTRKTHLMEWTGAKDKNGTDIYEGDILMDEYNRVLLTEWRRYGFCFKAVTETNFVYAYDIMQWFEGGTLLPLIIGNIYENPEILE